MGNPLAVIAPARDSPGETGLLPEAAPIGKKGALAALGPRDFRSLTVPSKQATRRISVTVREMAVTAGMSRANRPLSWIIANN